VDAAVCGNRALSPIGKYAGGLRGANVEQPRNLAKSVTVE
jgi:glucosamine 6-phosphate synthetase-like amidotransferase/phosphosugar isomerase protein